MLYYDDAVEALDEWSLPGYTSQPHFDSVAYVDKHDQPSKDPTLPNLIKEYYGKMTGELVAGEFPNKMKSGDVHTAIYDFGKKQTYISHGITDEKGEFISKAWKEPFFRFDNDKLWNESKPEVTLPDPEKQPPADIPKDRCVTENEVMQIARMMSDGLQDWKQGLGLIRALLAIELCEVFF